MIKLVQCIRSKPGQAPLEFRTAWEKYGELLKGSLEILGAREVELTTTLAVDANLELILTRDTAEPFEAMAEIWWKNATALEEALARPEAAGRVQRIQEFQETFMDLPRCVFFFAFQESTS